MDDIYKNIEEQNPNKKRKIFIRERKLNISVVFITQSYFAVPKNIRQNLTHYIVKKIGNKKFGIFWNFKTLCLIIFQILTFKTL